MFRIIAFLAPLFTLALLSGCGSGTTENTGKPGAPAQVRLGYFANVTHAQALIGTSQGQFQKALGNVPLKTAVFNAGPSVVEAFFAGELDIAYIGPSPAINAHVKSKGREVRVVAGSAANGVVIVARKDSGIKTLAGIAGKKIATPQYGNTQDVSARHYMVGRASVPAGRDAGPTSSGFATEILNVANAEQLGLFQAGKIDAVWAPEPWGARVIHEAGGVLIEEEKNLWPEKNFAVTLVLVSRKFLEQNPETVEKFLRAHIEVTAWINAHRDEAADIVNGELKKLVGKGLKNEVLREAFGRITFTSDPFPESIRTFAAWSYDLKITKEAPDLKDLIDLRLLEKIHAENPK